MGMKKRGGREAIESFYTRQLYRKARTAYMKKVIFCERCGALGTQVHHKVRLTTGNLEDVEISAGEGNFELLCDKCHEEEHGKHKMRALPDGHVPLDSPPG